MNTQPRRFALVRDHDVSGVSGTGHVADGVLWPDGTASVRWRGEHPSTVHWDRGWDSVQHIHGHGGHTRILWIDPDPDSYDDTCPYCPDGHGRPDAITWGAYVRREPAGRPNQLVLMHADGSHVCPGDARWVWQVLNGCAD